MAGANFVSGTKLADAVQVGRDDACDLRVATHSSTGHTEDDKLTAGSLDAPGMTGLERRSASAATMTGGPSSFRPMRLLCELTQSCAPVESSGSHSRRVSGPSTIWIGRAAVLSRSVRWADERRWCSL